MILAYDMERVRLLAQEMISAIDQLRMHKELDIYVSWSLLMLKRQCGSTSRWIESHGGREGKCGSRD